MRTVYVMHPSEKEERGLYVKLGISMFNSPVLDVNGAYLTLTCEKFRQLANAMLKLAEELDPAIEYIKATDTEALIDVLLAVDTQIVIKSNGKIVSGDGIGKPYTLEDIKEELLTRLK